jgi:feruloyl esterase
VTDGIIDDPTMFCFDPEVLACGAGAGVLNESVCLTPAQVPSVRAAYEPIADAAGRIVYPAFELGSDTDVFSANINATTGEPQLSYTILQDFWRGAIFNSSTWTPLNFSTADMDPALSINPDQVNTGGTDLSAYY